MVTADMAYCERAASPFSTHFDGVLVSRPGRRVGHGGAAAFRRRRPWSQGAARNVADLQGEHIGDESACMLFGKSIVAGRQDTIIQRVLQSPEPTEMEGMEDSGINASPIMQRHPGISSLWHSPL